MLQYRLIPVTSFQQNCSLLWCDKTGKAVFVDPGGDVEQLIAVLDSLQLSLQAVWLTHGHLDHIGASDLLRQRFNIPVIGPHRLDEFLFDAIQTQCQMFGFDMIDRFMPDQWLDEGDVLTLGEESFNVIHTPGHTPGHIVIQHIASKHLWVGDVLFCGSIGRTDFPRGNYDQLMTSIRKKLLVMDDDYQFIPGHGPESSIGHERLHNPFIGA